MVNVVVNSKKKVLITANTLSAADTNVVLRNTTGMTQVSGATRLDRLTDVSEMNPVTGDTLVYNSANDTYVVQKLSIENVADIDVLALDGGTF